MTRCACCGLGDQVRRERNAEIRRQEEEQRKKREAAWVSTVPLTRSFCMQHESLCSISGLPY
jgi:hypothetical protein